MFTLRVAWKAQKKLNSLIKSLVRPARMATFAHAVRR